MFNNLDNPVNGALRANDVHKWAPKAPTRLLYCTADDQVPFRNSLTARDTMQARGAADLQAIDVNPTADHGQCVTPALTNTVLFFAGLQQIGTVPVDERFDNQILTLFPNPSNGEVFLSNLPLNGQIEVFDVAGRLHYTGTAGPGDARLDLGALPAGVYGLRFWGGGKVWWGRAVKE